MFRHGCPKTMADETLLNNVSAVGFSGKSIIVSSVSFHHEMFCVTNFGLVLGVCIVHFVIFIKKYLVTFFVITTITTSIYKKKS